MRKRAHDAAVGLAPVSDTGRERLVAHSNGECTRSAPTSWDAGMVSVRVCLSGPRESAEWQVLNVFHDWQEREEGRERGMQREEKTDRERKARIWKGNEGERRRNGKMQDEEGKKMERQR